MEDYDKGKVSYFIPIIIIIVTTMLLLMYLFSESHPKGSDWFIIGLYSLGLIWLGLTYFHNYKIEKT
jgi:hypothetical protein